MKALFFLIVCLVAAVMAGPIEDLKSGEWYEVPNSKLDAVKPNPLPPGSFSGLITAWNSGAYDTKRDRFLVWGGGHCDYAGNEIYAFDVNTFTWSRIWGPTPNQYIPVCATSYQTYQNGDPSARHIYDGLEYIPDPVDAMMIVGGPWWGSSGGGGTWLYRFQTGTWERQADEPNGRNGDESAYDPATGHVFQRGSHVISEFDPVNNTWTQRNNQSPSGNGGWWGQSTGAIDTKRRKMVFASSSVWAIYDLNTNEISWPATTGDNEILNTTVPGIDYDPVSDRMVAWNGGTDVYTFNIDALEWTRHPPAATNTVTPPQPPHTGTYGRFRYIPSKNAFICVSGVTQNVFIYRFAPGTTSVEAQTKSSAVKISISPNPFRSSVQIKTNQPNPVIKIYDLNGRQVHQLSGETWNAAGVPAGIYLLKVKTANGVKVKRLILNP
jgi:hypothetical protein